MANFQNEIASLLYRALGGLTGSEIMDAEAIKGALRTPPKEELGDHSFPCFQLAKQLRRIPQQIASELSDIVNKALSEPGGGSGAVQAVKSEGGYVNFAIDPVVLTDTVLSEILSARENYGRNSQGEGRLVVIDYSAPNLGKPMHVGHIRSTIIGDSLIRILNFSGYMTHGINYLGDIGLHMGKLIAAYNRWGDNERLRANPDREMLELYVRFGRESKEHPELNLEARAALQKLESNDPEYVRIWGLIKDFSMQSFNRAYELLDVSFDEITGQSLFSERGKRIVMDGLARGIVSKEAVSKKHARAKGSFAADMETEEGEDASEAFVVSLKGHGLPDKVVLRGDETALYSTQDLGAAVERHERFKFDKMLYVIATEQSLYMKQVFKVLELLGYQWAKDCHHVGFGLINMESGKMSTREGNVIYLEELLERAVSLAREKVQDRGLPAGDIERIAKAVGIGAVKYNILCIDSVQDITFSWERALDFDGNSAPYIQYNYVRALSLLKNSGQQTATAYNPHELSQPEEARLVKKLSDFPEVVERGARSFKPHIVANYLYELAGLFTNFYQNVRILNTPEQASRLALVEATRTTIGNGLGLLGIKTPEKM